MQRRPWLSLDRLFAGSYTLHNFLHRIGHFIDLVAVIGMVAVLGPVIVRFQRAVYASGFVNEFYTSKNTTEFFFRIRFVLLVQIMNFYRQNSTGYVSICKLYVPTKRSSLAFLLNTQNSCCQAKLFGSQYVCETMGIRIRHLICSRGFCRRCEFPAGRHGDLRRSKRKPRP